MYDNPYAGPVEQSSPRKRKRYIPGMIVMGVMFTAFAGVVLFGFLGLSMQSPPPVAKIPVPATVPITDGPPEAEKPTKAAQVAGTAIDETTAEATEPESETTPETAQPITAAMDADTESEFTHETDEDFNDEALILIGF